MTAHPLQLPGRVLRRARPARDAARPHLVVVPPPAAHPLLWTVATLLVLAMSVFAAVTLNALAADDAVNARRLDAQVRDAEVQYGQLLAEVATLESPARIAAAAEELGLVYVGTPRQLRVQRLLPADGAAERRAEPSGPTDRLKPLLSSE